MQPLSMPYKSLARCSLAELAIQQQVNARRGRETSGVLFASKDETSEKDAARRLIMDMLRPERMPEHISVLSMPGLGWNFEGHLLKYREPNWRLQQSISSMTLTCVENDRFVYYSSATKLPGNKHSMIRTLERPDYAERAIGNGMIGRYIFANVDQLMEDGREAFDVAWLDYTGPLTVERVKLIRAFWQRNVRRLLVVTALKARENKETMRVIDRHGGRLEWLRAVLPGHEEHAIEYSDGSPMVQFAVSKIPAPGAAPGAAE